MSIKMNGKLIASNAIKPYESTLTYKEGDVVAKYNDVLDRLIYYKSKTDSNTNHDVTNTTYWEDLTDYELMNNSKALETGEPCYDKEILDDVIKYKRSTFDKSKFAVIGSPTITKDGIVSNFSHSPEGYVQSIYFKQLLNHSWKIKGNFRKNTSEHNCCLQGFVYWASQGGIQSWDGSVLSFIGVFGANDDKTGENQGMHVSLSNFTEGQLINYSLEFNYSTGQYTLKVWGDSVDVVSNTYTPPTANKQLNGIINANNNSRFLIGRMSGTVQSPLFSRGFLF